METLEDKCVEAINAITRWHDAETGYIKTEEDGTLSIIVDGQRYIRHCHGLDDFNRQWRELCEEWDKCVHCGEDAEDGIVCNNCYSQYTPSMLY